MRLDTPAPHSGPGSLRRDLGRLESYALLIGILVGAGIFRVTSDAWALTGPSVVLGYLVLAPAVLATSVPYAVFLSTPLGLSTGGEYTHIARTFGSMALAFVVAWLKIIAYIGALAYLARAFADYLLQGFPQLAAAPLLVALAVLCFFFFVHARGARWFGALQVGMFVVLGVSIVVLVVPGCFAIAPSNYRPFFTGGVSGFCAALGPLFFAYAGFESLAQAAGVVRDSTRHLPRVFLRGVLATTLVFACMSAVAFGVLPGESLRGSTTPMADVARVYLPRAGSAVVILGALMAITTSINATMLVPSRLALMLVADGLAPSWLGLVNPRTGTPRRGLTLTFVLAASLLVSGHLSVALHIAVLAMVLLYFLHSLALLALPRRDPALYASRTIHMPVWLQQAAALLSALSMLGLVLVILVQDLRTLRTAALRERLVSGGLTSLELLLAWSVIGLVVFAFVNHRRRNETRNRAGQQ